MDRDKTTLTDFANRLRRAGYYKFEFIKVRSGLEIAKGLLKFKDRAEKRCLCVVFLEKPELFLSYKHYNKYNLEYWDQCLLKTVSSAWRGYLN